MDGSTLGERYRVEARIGAGGMAEVYRGLDPVLNRTVAIKVLLPQFARDAGFVARFRREAQAAARLNHPTIVGVYDTGADGETQFIVMEFIEGRTLGEFLAKGGRPTVTQSVELAQRIATALGIAHQQGIVHRDIKPANVMVTRDGSVKVMDFGIARIETVETAPQTSSVLGTPTYLSPEQAQGQKVDARSDIYSLGCVLYELLTGRPPFLGDSPVAIAYKQVNETPVPPGQRNPDVPPRLDAVVMKMLSKNPTNRYQTAEALIEDLERVKKGQDVDATPLMAAAAGDATQVIARPQPTQVLPPPGEPEGSGRKIWLGILIGLLVVLLLGAGGYLLASVLTDGGETEAFAMPNVKGVQFEDAKEELEGLDLVVLDPVEEESDEAEGTVLRQDPQPETEVRPGEAVTLTIAIPITEVEVPDLTGYTPEDAASLFVDLGLDLGIGEKIPTQSDTIDTGRIADQEPAPGTLVEPGTLITVFVVEGPSTVTLGDYTCLTFGKANSALRKVNLVAEFAGTATPLAQCPNTNFVALQEPGPGSVVEAGSTVQLYTGSESSPTATPDD